MRDPPQPFSRKYRVRELDINGQSIPFVLNGSGGSSALVSLSNAIIQTSDFHFAIVTEGGINGPPKYVQTQILLQLIELAVVQRIQEGWEKKAYDADTMLRSWQGFRMMIRRLPKCFDVYPIFESCSSFAEPSEVLSLFKACGFDVYHGLEFDPEDPETTEAIASKSYNEIVDILKSPSQIDDKTAHILKKFLDDTKDGLTTYGFRCLKRSLNVHNRGVLFRNNLCNLIYKESGRELALREEVEELVNNRLRCLGAGGRVGEALDHFSGMCHETLMVFQDTEEQFKRTPDAIWKVLDMGKRNGKLLAFDFSEIKLQTMGHDADGSISLRRQAAPIEEEPKQKMKMSKPSSKQRRKLKTKMAINKSEVQQPANVMACDKKTEELKGSKSSGEEKNMLNLQEEEHNKIELDAETEEERDDKISQTFIRFLKVFKEEGASAPFFEGQIIAMDHYISFNFRIDYKDLEIYDRQIARNVCNKMPRIYDRLKYCACSFMLEHVQFKTKSEEVFKRTRIEINNLPPPNSVQALSEFAMQHDMHEIRQLFDYGGTKVNATTYMGRKAALGYLRFILKKHKAGYCWNGSFVLEDFIVLVKGGDLEFVITKEASEGFSKENAISDFNRFCVILFRLFMDDAIDEMPAYFDQFQLDYFLHMPSPEDSEAYDI